MLKYFAKASDMYIRRKKPFSLYRGVNVDKIEALAKFLEITDLEQIEETNYDAFIVNPHTKKLGDSVEQKQAKINLVKLALNRAGISNIVTLEGEDFTPALYDPISKAFYKECEDLTKIGIHDLINTLYFLCGGSSNTTLDSDTHKALTVDYRALFDGQEIDDDREEIEISDGDYLVLTDDEADQAFEEQCRSYIDDCMEIPENIRHYFDEEKFIEDCRNNDGRGHILASYDGEENEIQDPESKEWFYIYRTN